jgi:hypothetical protein
MNDPITPAEAVDLLLEVSSAELVGKVTWEWLCDKQSGLPDGLALESAYLDDEAKAAMAAVTTLRRHVRDHEIQLWGRRNGKGDRVAAEDGDQQEGELLIWAATFEGPEIPDGPFKVQAWRYTDVRFVRSEVQRIAAPPRKDGRGRKSHDWTTIEARVHALMEYYGDFVAGDLEWNCRARLEEKIIDEFGIGKTQLAEKLPAMLDRWRATKSGN